MKIVQPVLNSDDRLLFCKTGRSVLGRGVILVLTLFCLSPTSFPSPPAKRLSAAIAKQNSSASTLPQAALDGFDRLDDLVQQLDSPKYSLRQEAMRDLLAMGAPALKPLALKVLRGTPESMWRAKQAIESIATSGNEETFFQAVNILQLLFNYNNDSINAKIAELEARWKYEQKRSVLRALEQKGAGVVENNDGFDPFGRLNPGFNHMIMVEPDFIVDDRSAGKRNPNATGAASSKPVEQKKSSEIAGEIDKILRASLEENRERIFEQREVSNRLAGMNADNIKRRLEQGAVDPREIEMLIDLEMQMQMRNAVQLRGRSPATIQIVLDKQWQGTEAELNQLRRIDEPIAIQLSHTDLAEVQLKEISQIPSLVSLEISGDELSSSKLGLLDQADSSLASLRFVDRMIDELPFDQIGSNKKLVSVSFTRCLLNPKAIQQLAIFQNLVTIQFLEMQLGDALLASLEKLPNLRSVELQVCKFPKSAYLQFKRNVPHVAINFTPQAFLGVRGPVRFTDDTERVEITQVVPGSAAEEGGMRSGDIVVSIDGVKVDRFEDLRLQIAQYKAGDRLKVVVARGAEKKELTIELKPYDSSLE